MDPVMHPLGHLFLGFILIRFSLMDASVMGKSKVLMRWFQVGFIN
jgi:hypothetical protein